jgi:chromosome segregation ATPase
MDMNDYVYQDLMEELRDRRTDATEMDARIRQLLGDTEQLRKERDELRQQIENLKNGFEGCCYACEPVGEMNKKLLKERDELVALNTDLLHTINRVNTYLKAAKEERDSARREVCEFEKYCLEEAAKRGWDCFKKETP